MLLVLTEFAVGNSVNAEPVNDIAKKTAIKHCFLIGVIPQLNMLLSFLKACLYRFVVSRNTLRSWLAFSDYLEINRHSRSDRHPNGSYGKH